MLSGLRQSWPKGCDCRVQQQQRGRSQKKRSPGLVQQADHAWREDGLAKVLVSYYKIYHVQSCIHLTLSWPRSTQERRKDVLSWNQHRQQQLARDNNSAEVGGGELHVEADG